VLSLVHQPIVFFHARLTTPPSWWLAFGGPLGCAALAMVSHAILSEKITGPIVATAVGSRSLLTSLQYMGVVNAAFVYVVVWLTASAFMMSFDVLLRGAPDALRILEGNALAFYSQLPWLALLVALAAAFEPPAAWMLDGPIASAADLERFKRLLQQDPFLATVRGLNECFAVWLYVLFGISYHVATSCPLSGSLLLALTTYGVFHLLHVLL
jgi:hypothetical protein